MKFVEYVDYGAPEHVILRLAEISRISADLVRLTYVRQQGEETVAACHVIYGFHEWCSAWATFNHEDFASVLAEVNATAPKDWHGLGLVKH